MLRPKRLCENSLLYLPSHFSHPLLGGPPPLIHTTITPYPDPTPFSAFVFHSLPLLLLRGVLYVFALWLEKYEHQIPSTGKMYRSGTESIKVLAKLQKWENITLHIVKVDDGRCGATPSRWSWKGECSEQIVNDVTKQ